MNDFMMGQIVWLAFDYETDGFMKCDGRQLKTSEYQALFSIIGNKYGGDGRENFALPNINIGTGSGSFQICVQGIYPPRK